MKDIKFRAWDTELKEWLPSSEIGHYLGELFAGNVYVRTRLLFMQFTGLRDKNGKEIYEGDICRWPSGHLSQISWWEERACFKAVGITQKHGVSRSGIVTSYIEVIGNIYENPELLNN